MRYACICKVPSTIQISLSQVLGRRIRASLGTIILPASDSSYYWKVILGLKSASVYFPLASILLLQQQIYFFYMAIAEYFNVIDTTCHNLLFSRLRKLNIFHSSTVMLSL